MDDTTDGLHGSAASASARADDGGGRVVHRVKRWGRTVDFFFVHHLAELRGQMKILCDNFSDADTKGSFLLYLQTFGSSKLLDSGNLIIYSGILRMTLAHFMCKITLRSMKSLSTHT